MATNIFVGSRVRLSTEPAPFTDADGNPTDPNSVKFKIKDPDGIETVYAYGVDVELVRQSPGVYYVDWGVTKAGNHSYRFEGKDGVSAPYGAYESTFKVETSVFTYT